MDEPSNNPVRTDDAVLNATPDEFWSASVDLAKVRLGAEGERRPVLEQLGASPFERGRFPLLGILATVYDHIAEHVGKR